MMSEAVDLSIFSMLMCGVLLLVPIILGTYLKLGITKKLLISSSRMVIQLILIGFFLEFLFKLNNPLVNFLWFLVMIFSANVSIINNSGLKFNQFIYPIFFSILLSNVFVVMYFNYFIVKLEMIFDARYMIAIGGMVLGNSLRANVVGLGDFYKSINREEQLYLYKLSLGASRYEALLPFAKRSFLSALNPTLATMATVGIVSLPGMMTGQILGGSVPLVAIKYQIAIMIAIVTSTVLSISLSLLFTVKYTFNKSGVLNKTIFKQKK